MTLKWHVSTFDAKLLPIPIEWREKLIIGLAKWDIILQ